MVTNLLHMEQDRRFRVFRVYMDSGSEELPEDNNASGSFHGAKVVVGDSRLSSWARREQYNDSRLSVSDDRDFYYWNICAQMVGLMIFLCALFVNVGNWKGGILFGLGLVFILVKLGQLVYPYVKRWRKEID